MSDNREQDQVQEGSQIQKGKQEQADSEWWAAKIAETEQHYAKTLALLSRLIDHRTKASKAMLEQATIFSSDFYNLQFNLPEKKTSQ